MNQELLERILSCDQLPSLPAVAVKVIELTARPNISMDELGETIQNDQGLAAKVLKTVNSSFYGLRRPCSTISQALVMLGLSAVKSLTLSFSLVSSIESRKDERFDYIAYWRRGLYTAVAAKMLAHRARLSTEDEAFLGALLQDVGMIAMHRALREPYAKVLAATSGDHRSLVRCELAELEMQHPDVGAMLAHRWKLPDELVMPVKYHERPTAAPEEHAALVRCVGLGNLVHDVLTVEEASEPRRRFHTRAKEWFDLTSDACDEIIRGVSEHAREMSTLFRLDTGSRSDAEEIIERAQRQAESLRQSAASAAEHGAAMKNLVSDGDELDPLTGVLTRERGFRAAEEAFDAARAQSRSVAMLSVAIDDLSRHPDGQDHERADVALVETATLLEELLGPLGGVVSRWDQGAFLVTMPGHDRVEAVRIAAEVRTLVQSRSAAWLLRSGAPVPTTVSVGVAAAEARTPASPFVRVQQLIAATVRACEAAGTGGGNAVRAFAPRTSAAA